MGIGSRVGAAAVAVGFLVTAAPPVARAAGPDHPATHLPGGAVPPAAPGTHHPAPGGKGFAPSLFPPAEHNGHAAGHNGHDGHNGHNGQGDGHCGPDCHHEEHEEGGFFGRAEYLLLRPRRGAFDFALVDPSRDLAPAGRLESLNYELRSGARATLGYRMPGAPWDLAFTYTYLRSNADRILTAPPGGTLYATLTRPGLIDEAVRAAGEAGLQYNTYDIEIGRRVHASERATARLFGGARFASIRQDVTAVYDGGGFPPVAARNARVRSDAKFDAFGPILGGEGTLNVYRGFHLYARGSAGLLTGRVVNTLTETNNGGATLLADVEYRTRKVVPTVGLAIGGGWQYHRVSVRAGYEITHYFGLIDQPRFTDDFSEGRLGVQTADLSLEGLFVQMGLAF